MKRVHTIDSWATIGIAALAFGLSYTKLVDLAERAGYDPYAAHVWPLIVDGLTIVATRGVLRLTHHRGYAWALLAAGTIVSMVAAVANQLLPPGPLPPIASAAVSVVPPLCLLVAPHLAVLLARDAQPQPDVDGVAPVADEPATLDPPAVKEPVDRRTRALELLATTHLSIRAVAKEVGVTDTTVRRWKAADEGSRDTNEAVPIASLVRVGGT
jgi:hypothetical protein